MISVINHDEAMTRVRAPADKVWILRIPGIGRDATARKLLRLAVLTLAKAWHGPGVVLNENSNLPVLVGAPWSLSISYDGLDGWVAWSASGAIGLDVEPIRTFPDMAEVSCQFLSAEDTYTSPLESPEVAFTRKWTTLEARYKLECSGASRRARVDHLRVGNCMLTVAH